MFIVFQSWLFFCKSVRNIATIIAVEEYLLIRPLITPQQIDTLRKVKSETQNLEFKEAKAGFDSTNLLEYCVGISNEGGGKLLLGIVNKPPRPVVGTAAFPNLIKVAEDIFNKLKFRVDVEEVKHPDGRVLVFHIPSRPVGEPRHLGGKYLMRSGESLVPMSSERLKEINDESRSGLRGARMQGASIAVGAIIALGLIGFLLFNYLPRPHDRDKAVIELHPTTDKVTAEKNSNPPPVSKPATSKLPAKNKVAAVPQAPDAELSIILIKKDAFAVWIKNNSTITATDAYYYFEVFGLDRADESGGPVSLKLVGNQPTWIHKHDAIGPFSAIANVNPPLRKGERIFGWIGLNCLNCSRKKLFWVYQEIGKGGWYSEIPEKDLTDSNRVFDIASHLRTDPNYYVARIPLSARQAIED